MSEQSWLSEIPQLDRHQLLIFEKRWMAHIVHFRVNMAMR